MDFCANTTSGNTCRASATSCVRTSRCANTTSFCVRTNCLARTSCARTYRVCTTCLARNSCARTYRVCSTCLACTTSCARTICRANFGAYAASSETVFVSDQAESILRIERESSLAIISRIAADAIAAKRGTTNTIAASLPTKSTNLQNGDSGTL